MDRVGVYVHLPFCERVCPYCDFAVVADAHLAPEREARYAQALEAELGLRATAFADRELASLYFGGGTPSLFRPETIAALIEQVTAAFPQMEPVEVTLEVNPGSLDRSRLQGFREAGVNRVSIGVQSFDARVLKRLGRAHRPEEAHATLAEAREVGFERLSLDLIHGAPEQDEAVLARDLEQIAEIRPDHVSAYALTIERGTPYERAVERGSFTLPGEDAVLAMMDQVAAGLGEIGLRAYELSSYARPGAEAVHNARYWQRRPVLGLGMGAWSLDPPSPDAPFGTRRANPRGLEAYLAPLEQGGLPAAELDVPGAREARGEATFLALRTAEGLRAAPFEAEFGGPPRRFFADALDRLCRAGLLEEGSGGDLVLTPRGRRLSDSVFAEFV